MDFNEYQRRAYETAIYPNKGNNLVYPVMALAEEAGEVLGKFAKSQRDDFGIVTDSRKEAVLKEMGDVLWQLAAIASELEVPLGLIAEMNLEKLKKRKESGTLQGSGDER